MDVLDTRQWDELASASSSPLQPWPPIFLNVASTWEGFIYPQPPAQGFIPDAFGAQCNFAVHGLLDHSIGVVNPYPSDLNYDDHREVIGSMTPAIDIRRSLIPLVAQRPYANNRRNRDPRKFKADRPIYFDTYSGPGLLAKDALDKNFKALMGREDPMLAYGTAISLRFEFEGYASWTCQVKTRDSRKVSHPIPRQKLAHEVAKKLVAFLNKRQATFDKSGKATVPRGPVDFNDFVLVRLDHVSKSSWQPQFTMIVRDA
ncbi:hypothetical protein BJ322DRAFT_1108386 [Thelephora terrestris]|uniref:Uncharacterized protein n=1 Tax=Thelephora terrestris TaxID=56493 RepID=A0A9P6HF35_9AGAM|nr:hypothetical protein BJ322DRAFT_1108386 [Thelephora terrestris]